MLKVQSISSYYGNLRVLHGVSLHVSEGETVALIGANGAGKSTLMKSITGLLPPRKGSIKLFDEDIAKMAPAHIIRRGIALAPEGRKLFATLTVEDNLMLGAYHRYSADRAQLGADLEHIFGIFPRLKERRAQLAGTLSGGEQQMVAVGRALMARPKLLLLDEPSMGLAPTIIEEIFAVLRDLCKQGLTLLLVEQNVRLAFAMAKRAYVFETGRVALQGPVDELMANKEVKRAYLGKGYKEVWE
jgi:branched-chain amino acid transport system ATP-binding protein